MSDSNDKRTRLSFIAELCAHLSDEEIIEAEERFWGYVDIVRRIYERIDRERSQAQPPAGDPDGASTGRSDAEISNIT